MTLENQDNLTFLYRAPKMLLGPLNVNAMAANYKENIGLSPEQALEMAKLTKGYSYAFQILGYLLWQSGGEYSSLISEYRQYLEERSYEKIWTELSPKDRELTLAIAHAKTKSREEIKNYLHIADNQLNPYRRRLIRKGIVDGNTRGYMYFTLPFFNDFVLEND